LPEPGGHALVDAIAAFLSSIGLPPAEMPLPRASSLPGVAIDAGRLLYTRTGLVWPGDLLHEAGHIAVTPGSLRPALRDRLDAEALAPHAGEVEATAWAYAATVALGLEPTVLFHAGGYRGASQRLAFTYANGVYPGAAGLEAAGMTLCGEAARVRGVPAYPHMIRWLRT
jgi:hypothetical protein